MAKIHKNLTSCVKRNKSFLLVGPPGIAKTGIVLAAAAEAGMEVIISRASTAERTDMVGCYVPDTEEGVTRALPLEMLHYLRTSKHRILFFLDDFGQAPEDVQNASMSLWDKIGGLPDNVLICAATNRVTDKAGVRRLIEPLRSRFRKAFVIPTPDTQGKEKDLPYVLLGTWEDQRNAWLDWALDYGAPAEVIAFIRATGLRYREEVDSKGNVTVIEENPLYAWRPDANPAMRFADFRNWEYVIDDWNDGERDFDMIAASIGKPVAMEFLAYARLANDLPSPDQIWADPQSAKVPESSSAQFLVVSMLASATKVEHIPPTLQYVDRLPRVMGALLVRDLQKRHEVALNNCPEYREWFLKNKDLFTVG